jgi:sec-independent protein translocase protein TatC
MALLDRLNRRNKNKEEGAEMSFIDHLEELRWVILYCVIAALVGALAVGLYHKWFFDHVVMAPAKANFVTYDLMCAAGQKLGMGSSLCIEPFKVDLLSTKVYGQFNMMFSFSLTAGFILAFPFIFWMFWRFIKPALTDKELKGIRGVIFWVSLMFFIGIAFGYFFLSPYAINFFATFQLSSSIKNMWAVDDYISMLTSFTLGCGLAFQLPLVLYFLAKIGIVTAAFLKKYFRHAIVVIVIIAAIITPPDGITQIIVATPLIILYWISIGLVSRVNRRQAKQEVEEWS